VLKVSSGSDRSDKAKLGHHLGIKLRHNVDIADVAKRCGRTEHGLKNICLAVMGRKLDKKLSVSNWARRPLPQKLIQYAATDAWLLVELYCRLKGVETEKSDSDSEPETKQHYFASFSVADDEDVFSLDVKDRHSDPAPYSYTKTESKAETKTTRQRGTVKYVHPNTWGFIGPDDGGPKIWFRGEKGSRMKKGQRVIYDTAIGIKGLYAFDLDRVL
jgi:cold shock CspA family protein